MQKKAAFILLLTFLLSSSTFNQLLRLHLLVTHYVEHQQRDSNLSIMNFLSMHYWGNDTNDNDEDKDLQLPFKTFNIHSFQLSFLSSSRIINIKRTAQPVVITDYPVLDDSHLANPAINSLFRPPRA